MAHPWLSYSVALVVAALVILGTMSLFSTSPLELNAQEKRHLPPGIANASEAKLIVLATSGTRDQKIAALLKLAESREEVSPAVVRAVGMRTMDPDELVRAAAEVSIKRIGAPAAVHVQTLFDSDEAMEYRAACAILQSLGPDAKGWAPQLGKQLKSDNASRVMAALFALQNMGKENLPLMEDLIKLLDHRDFNIQCGVCRIMERLGPDGAPAQDRLVLLLNDGVLSARSWAAIALGAIGPTPKHDVVALLNKKLTAFTQIEKERALIGLAHIGPQATKALDEVTRLMKDPRQNTQTQAAVTYWTITGDAKTANEVLVEKMAELSYTRAAIQRIGDMGPAGAPALSALTNELNNREPDIRELAVMAIGKLGAAAKPAIKNLEKLLNDKDLLIRQAAEDSIKSINAAAEKQPAK